MRELIMSDYNITVDAIYTANFTIKADSLESAQIKAEQYINKNNLNFQLSEGSIEIGHIEKVK